MLNQPTGPVVSETMPEQPLDPLKNLDWEDLKLDWWGMYPSFKIPGWNTQETVDQFDENQGYDNFEWEKINDSEKEWKLNEGIFEKHSENPATPILERVNNDISWVLIWDSDLEEIYSNLWIIDWDKDVISELSDAIDKSNLDKDTKKILSNIILQIWKNSDNRLKENKDGKIEKPEEFKWNNLLENDKYSDIVDLLAKNYISFPEWDLWEWNFEKDIQTSIDITINKVIAWKNLPKTEGFTYAMNEVHSWDLEMQLEALSYIYSWVNTNEWMKWSKSNKAFTKIKWEHLKSKAEYYDFKISQFESQIKDTRDDIEKNRLEWIVKKLKKDKEKDDFEWEVFSWDKDKESTTSNKEQDPFETA